MRTHHIAVVEHYFKDKIDPTDHCAEPDFVTSNVEFSYATEEEGKACHKALEAYVTARGLPTLHQLPILVLPDDVEHSNDLPYDMPGASWCHSQNDHWKFAVYVYAK